ncbi:MAG: hypothetical protein INQ03_00060 [Candidatus Heimdallarchaeota archaeon]|nr:hypothetical protein [Candidatus Heimdallarchaeota archaeon]
MDSSQTYILGIIMAILAGAFVNLGVLLQKKVINQHLNDKEFLKNISKNKTWIAGMLTQMVIGGLVFYMIAQVFLGPALVPSIMSFGLIVLAIGSVKILNERLQKEEITGIIMMIIGIVIFSLSELSIDLATFDVTKQDFILRLAIYTSIFSLISIVLILISNRKETRKGILLALVSGLLYSLNTLWIGPMITGLTKIFTGTAVLTEIMLFVFGSLITFLATTFAVIYSQKAFREGQVNILSPLVGVPSYLSSTMTFFYVFILPIPSKYSVLYMSLGLVLIVISSFLLAGREAQLEEISIET